jgi:hypothetical protein
LDADHEPLDNADLQQRFSKKAKARADEFEDPDYYVSTHPPGPERLRDYLQESAFRSKHLYAAAARRSSKVFALLLIGVLVAALVFLPFTVGNAQLLAARALVIFLSSFPVSNELEQALAWQTATARADAVDRRLERMDSSSIEPVSAVFSDYSVATANAPPIPTVVYEAERDHLNQLWAERTQQLQDE